jgi:hypothetical protein
MREDQWNAICTQVREIAEALPGGAGVIDREAVQKFEAEWQELEEKLTANDPMGALLEGVDLIYYAVKAVLSGLWTREWAEQRMADVSVQLMLDAQIWPALLRAKYQTRMDGMGKNDAIERANVMRALGGT